MNVLQSNHLTFASHQKPRVRKPPTALKQVLTSETFKECSLFKQAGNFSMQLDSHAPNLFSNKHLIRNSINQSRFPGPSQLQPMLFYNNQQQTDYNLSLIDSTTPGRNQETPVQQNNRQSNLSTQMRVVELESSPQQTLKNKGQFSQSLVFHASRKSQNGSELQSATQQVTGSRQIDQLQIVPNKASKRTLSMGGYSLNASFRKYIGGSKGPATTFGEGTAELSKHNYTLDKNSILKSKYRAALTTKKAFDASTSDHPSQLSNFSRLFEHKNTTSHTKEPKGFSNLSQSLKLSKDQYQSLLHQHTLDSREQYLKNKNHRPSQLVNPIDPIDYKQVQGFDSVQKCQNQSATKPSKNAQTSEYEEPHNRSPKKLNERIDFLNHNVLRRPEIINKGRMRYVSSFYEQEHSAHNHADFKSKMDQFPNLFALKKTEFSKISNSIPATTLIIKSNFSGRVSHKR